MMIKKSRLPIIHILTIGLLPSKIKLFCYKIMGYKIGKNVSLGFGSVITGKMVQIGNNTEIGFCTIIRGNIIKIGSYVSIGSTTILDTPHLEIGDGAKINEQVFVGGMEFPESKLILGKNTIVMQLTYINTAMPVTVGDDSGIGGHCIIFSHGSWLNQLEGYPVQFAPVEIGKSVWLPWRIFVMPGAKIGDGSVIGANSLVAGKIPAKSLAAGSPAKVIRKAPDFPKHISDSDRIRMLEQILSKMIEYFNFYNIGCKKDGNSYLFTQSIRKLIRTKIKRWIMVADLEKNACKKPASRINLFLSLHGIPDEIRLHLISHKTMWIDIQHKERSILSNDLGEEVALFLKRYGIRLNYIA